jgi:O-antigen ligase
MDSSKGLIMIFFFYSLVRIQNGRNLLIHISSILLVMMVLISYQTRWLIVTLVFGIVLMLVFLGLHKFFKIGVLLAIITSFIIPFLNFVNPEAFQIIISRFGFIENLKEATEVTDLELTRGASIINSISTVYDNNALLTGLGYGSWYTDSYFPMLDLTSAAFDEESLEKGHFYRVHDFLFHFLFKFGIIGLFLYCKSFLNPLFSIWKTKLYLLKNSSFSQLVLLIYIGILPMVLTFMFTTAKGLLISALFIVTFKLLISYFKTEIDSNYNE